MSSHTTGAVARGAPARAIGPSFADAAARRKRFGFGYFFCRMSVTTILVFRVSSSVPIVIE